MSDTLSPSQIVEKLLQSRLVQEFCARHGIDPENYRIAASDTFLQRRFVRLNPSSVAPPYDDINRIKEAIGIDEFTACGMKLISRPSILQKFGFLELQQTTSGLQQLRSYQKGIIMGMDPSSALAIVAALQPQVGDVILDICCAPGAKLLLIGDLIRMQQPVSAAATSTAIQTTEETVENKKRKRASDAAASVPAFELTGIDISAQRLFIAKNLLKKYGAQNTRIIWADGTKFGVSEASQPLRLDSRQWRRRMKQLQKQQSSSSENEDNVDAESGDECECEDQQQLPDYVTSAGVIVVETEGVFMQRRIAREQQASKKRKMQTKDEETTSPAESQTTSSTGIELYDKVIVDAECTTDGSVRHLLHVAAKKLRDPEPSAWDTFIADFFSESRLQKIVELQKKLVMNGYRLTKPGGALVYSTCSLTRAQNENVVQWLLDTVTADTQDNYQAILVPIDFDAESLGVTRCDDAVMPLALRLDPVRSDTSGLFIAKMHKIPRQIQTNANASSGAVPVE